MSSTIAAIYNILFEKKIHIHQCLSKGSKSKWKNSASAIKKVYTLQPLIFSTDSFWLPGSRLASCCYCTLVVLVVVLAAVYSYNSKSVRFTSHFDRDSWQRSHSQWQQLISKQSTVIVRRACAVNKQHLAMISGGGGSGMKREQIQ